MPTLAEVRNQYPQYNDLSDKDLADKLYQKFYSDMPRADFNKKVGLDTTIRSGDNSNEAGFGTKMSEAWQRSEFFRPLFEDIISALTLPGDVYQGKVDPRSDESLKRAAVLATIISPTSVATGSGAAIAAAQGAAPAAAGPVAKTAVGQAAERLGIDLPRAISSDRPMVQEIGKVASNVPVGGAPLVKAAGEATRQLGDAAGRTEAAFGGRNIPRAGEGIQQGIESFAGKGGILAERAAEKFNRVDKLVNPDIARPLSETAQIASEIGLQRKAAALPESEAVRQVADAISRPKGLTYQGLKTLRTRIGEMLDNPSLLPSNISGAELKRVYGALTRDLRATVEAAGGDQAVRAFDYANRSFTKSMAIRENLNRVLKVNSPEAAFSRIEAMAGSSSRADIKSLAQVRAAIGEDNWNEVSSALVAKLGRDSEGNFSPQRFLTAWGKIGGAAKRILFRTTGRSDLAQSLDDIVTVSSRFKELDKYANPSGTARSAAFAALGASATPLLYGDVLTPLSAGATVLGNRVLANVLAKPEGAAMFSTWSKAYAAVTSRPSKVTAKVFRDASQALAIFALGEGASGDKDTLEKELRLSPLPKPATTGR